MKQAKKALSTRTESAHDIAERPPFRQGLGLRSIEKDAGSPACPFVVKMSDICDSNQRPATQRYSAHAYALQEADTGRVPAVPCACERIELQGGDATGDCGIARIRCGSQSDRSREDLHEHGPVAGRTDQVPEDLAPCSLISYTPRFRYQLVLERRLADFVLPEGWQIVAAGNPAKSKGVHFAMPYPLRSRFIHYTLEADLNEFCQWGFANDIDPLIIALLRCRGELLHQPPTQDVYAWAQPRSWARASGLYRAAKAQGIDGTTLFREMLVGTLGEAATTEFLAFAEMATRLPSPEAILLNPTTTPVPDDPDGRIAVAAALGRLMTPANIANAVAYLKRIASDGRIDMEFTTLAIRDAVARDERITLTREFTEFAIETQGALV